MCILKQHSFTVNTGLTLSPHCYGLSVSEQLPVNRVLLVEFNDFQFCVHRLLSFVLVFANPRGKYLGLKLLNVPVYSLVRCLPSVFGGIVWCWSGRVQ